MNPKIPSPLLPVLADPELYLVAAEIYSGSTSQIHLDLGITILPNEKPVRGSAPGDPQVLLGPVVLQRGVVENPDNHGVLSLAHRVILTQARILTEGLTNPDDQFSLVAWRMKSPGHPEGLLTIRFRSPRFLDRIDKNFVIAHLPELNNMSLPAFKKAVEKVNTRIFGKVTTPLDPRTGKPGNVSTMTPPLQRSRR